MNQIAKFHYSEAEKKTILKSMIVLIDSQEKVNGHITAWLDKNKIRHEVKSLDFGDYSFKIPALPELGIPRELYFTKDIVVERKNSLEELSQNLAQKREQFKNEFLRAKDCTKVMIVEKGTYTDILTGAYDTKFSSESYFASLISFQLKYNLNICFVGKEHAGRFLYAQIYQYLKIWLG